jgi:hypothetical protein
MKKDLYDFILELAVLEGRPIYSKEVYKIKKGDN